MHVPEYMATQTERMTDSLANFIATTREDKLAWQPQIEGSVPTRSVLEQVAECVVVNRMIAALLRGETPPPPAVSAAPPLVLATGAEAQEQLRASGTELAGAIRTMTEEDLERAYQHPRGQFLGANLIMMPLRNMAYHAGQINLIQMLAGDPEFHVPPQWR
ncbi:MAG: DinB superfamily [Chthonomonadaceae bacterium]|nr:DinB superfamily [Chthonomonadaceae bacterium]